jgi:excisionase family DNA binding protein
MVERRLLSVKEAAERLGVSPRKIYSLISKGELDGYAVGRRKVIYADSIPAYQERNRFPQKENPPPEQAKRRVVGKDRPVTGLKHLHL